MTYTNLRDAVDYVAAGAWFNGNSTTASVYLNGGSNPSCVSSGSLPKAWRDVLRGGANIVYIVHSYATPIAWVTADGTHVFPDVKYSRTTSRHQGIVRRAWAGRTLVTSLPVPADAA